VYFIIIVRYIFVSECIIHYNIVMVCCHPADDSDGKAGGSSLLGVVVGLLVFSALICFGLRLSTASRPRHFPTTNLYPNKLLCSRQTSRSPFIDFWRDCVCMCVCVYMCVCVCARRSMMWGWSMFLPHQWVRLEG